MPLSPGTKLGQYEVVESIGAGGMGEVYRARDTKLGRDVAIKVLPEEFARDRERLDRFEREARLLAQLNHANVATLHGLEEHNGQQFLVMELVEGETLAERIAKGPLPVDEAIPLFIQIAEGLEAAHEKGIIHRDLKPANVKIGPDGKPKILDFGLAKAFVGDNESAPDSSQSPTLTKGTALGAIMGTAAYMSPEQARGKPLDKRTDVWAFGCCLYEALTAKQLFARDNVTDTLAALVKEDPDWEALPSRANVRRLLRRCLRKDLSERLRDIGDARLELSEKETEASTTTHRAWPKRPKLAAVVVALAALFVGVLARDVLDTPSISQPMHLSLEITPAERIGDAGTVSGVSFMPNRREQWLSRTAIALSPNGQHLVFVGWKDGRQSLFHRPLEEPEARPIPGTENAVNPFFSPDGRWIGFWSEGEIKKIALSGGTPVPLCNATPIFGASWGADDTIVFAERSIGLLTVPAEGGEPREIIRSDGFQIVMPWLLPGASEVLFVVRRDGRSWDETDIVVETLASGERKVLVEGGAQPMYVESGHLLYIKLGVLWAAPFDVGRLELRARPVPVLEGIVQNVRSPNVGNRTGAAQITVSPAGNLAYLPGALLEGASRSLMWVDRNGESEPLRFDKGSFWYPRLSPDGDRIAMADSEVVSILDLRRQIQQRLPGGRGGSVGAWSPDGSRIVFSDTRDSPRNIFWQLADGSEPPERLTTSEKLQFPGPWSPDGSEILFSESTGGPYASQEWDILALRVPPSEETSRPVLAEAAVKEAYPALSPDGRWLAYASDESGRFEVYLRRYPSLEDKQQLSRSGGVAPVWSRSGDELFYMVPRSSEEGQEIMMGVQMSSSPDLRAGTPRELFRGQFVMGNFLASYDVTRDGRFLMVVPSETPAAVQTSVRVVLNWFEELNRLVPTE